MKSISQNEISKAGNAMNKKYKEKGNRIQVERLGSYTNEIEEVLKKQGFIKDLEEFYPEIEAAIDGYARKSVEETMMIKGYRKSNQNTTNRKTHSENLANIAVRIAKRTGLNENIVRLMAKYHDIGHTFLGHSGEWWISNIKEDYGMGYYVHNALGARELIYTNKIYDEIIETIKESYPEISEAKLNRIQNSLWLIMEAINSHNGEKSEYEYRANVLKTEKDFKQELIYCHTKKGFDRTLVPATREASLMRLCDKISYIPYDMVDGLREGFINELNDEYISVLTSLGITKEEIDICKQKGEYDSIAKRIQTILINDVVKNSDETVIRMSQENSKLMHQLRNINNEQIVDYVVLKEDNETYPVAIKTLMNKFQNIILEDNLLPRLQNANSDMEINAELEEKYKDSPYLGFINYICKTNPDDYQFTVDMIDEATKQSVSDELENAREYVQNNKAFIPNPEFPNRDARIKKYIEYYQGKDLENYKPEQIMQDIQTIINNINNSDKRSNSYLSRDERIAMEFGAKYISTLNDIEFMQLLQNTQIINSEQFASLTRKYKDIDLKSEVYVQPNWKKITNAQKESVEVLENDER